MTDLQQPRRLMVRGLRLGLVERGKIKIGVKGKEITSRSGVVFQPPKKLDHFVITTMQRGPDGNFMRDEELHKRLGDRPTRIPIRLLYDEIELNFQTRYIAFEGKRAWCRGDGVTADRQGHDSPIACPCRNLARDYDPKREGLGPACKLNGDLQCMIDGAQGVGGVWKFRTTSWNSTSGLVSSMALIQTASGGRLAGLPLDLTVNPKTTADPSGRMQTVYVVGIEYRGTMQELRDESYRLMLEDARHEERIKAVHESARALLAAPVIEEEEEDTVAEFYPEQAAAAAGVPIAEATVNEEEDEDEDPLKRYERELNERLDEMAEQAMDDAIVEEAVKRVQDQIRDLPNPEEEGLEHRHDVQGGTSEPAPQPPSPATPPSAGGNGKHVTVYTLQGKTEFEDTYAAVRGLVGAISEATLPEQLATLQVENAPLIEHTARYRAWRTYLNDAIVAAKVRIEAETGEAVDDY